jgi:hypothetical protein
MYRDEELRMVVEELTEAMRDQTRQLERLVDHLGQSLGKLPEGTNLSIIGSELVALHLRAKKLVADTGGPA